MKVLFLRFSVRDFLKLDQSGKRIREYASNLLLVLVKRCLHVSSDTEEDGVLVGNDEVLTISQLGNWGTGDDVLVGRMLYF